MALLGLGLAGCDQSYACPAIYIFSEATFRLHLPPAADVAAPETIDACQEPICTTATVPSLADTNVLQFSNPDVTGSELLGPGNVRILDLSWRLTNVTAADPSNYYMITVTDAAGQVTGKIAQEVSYTKTPDGPCGAGKWEGPLTSD